MILKEKSVIEREVRIAARPETIFTFFTDPAKMIQWKGIRAKLEQRPGGVYHVHISEKSIARGKYVEIVPPKRVVFTWGWEGENSTVPPGSSTVEITLIPDGEETIVRLRHYNLPEKEVQGHTEGWDHFLPRLQMAAAGRDPGPDPWAG